MKHVKKMLKVMSVVLFITFSIIFLISFTVLIYLYASGELPNYDEEWIVGKTQKQIERRYGKFDEFHECTTDDGKTYYLAIYYQTRTEPEPGPFHGTLYGRNFHITFNEEGIATSAQSVPLNPGG